MHLYKKNVDKRRTKPESSVYLQANKTNQNQKIPITYQKLVSSKIYYPQAPLRQAVQRTKALVFVIFFIVHHLIGLLVKK